MFKFGKDQFRKGTESLEAQLRELRRIKSFVRNGAWVDVRKLFEAEIDNHRKTIIHLADNPGKNEIEIVARKKTMVSLRSILTILDQLVEKSRSLQTEIDNRNTMVKQKEPLV